MKQWQKDQIEKTTTDELKEVCAEREKYPPDFMAYVAKELRCRGESELAELAESMPTELNLKPSFNKGGRGRFTRLDAPCSLKLVDSQAPILQVSYSPASNIWFAVLATIITTVMVMAITQASGYVFGLLFITWYHIITGVRRKQVALDLREVQQVVLDGKRKEFSVRCTLAERQTWLGLKPKRSYYDHVAKRLKELSAVPAVDGNLQTSRLPVIILLVIVLVLVAVALAEALIQN